MRDKNICIFAGMSNERDDPGTPDPEPAKESLSESEDGQVTKILFTQFLTF